MTRARRLRVWVTRAQPGAAATARRLEPLGFEPFIAPLLVVRDRPGPEIDLAGVGALAFTSLNGAAAFAARSPRRDLPVFAVGAGTAEAARVAGFRNVVSAEGHVADLAALILTHRANLSGAVLHAAPAEPAGDLVGALAAGGVMARREVVYETLATPPDAATASAIPTLSAVLLHSPKAAGALAAHLAVHPAPALLAVCLSPAVAAPLDPLTLRTITVAADPAETALLDALVAALRTTAQ